MRLSTSLAVAALLASGLSFQTAAIAAPQLSVQSEKAGHPRIAKAIADMEETERHLQAAPEDFGGHKAKTIQDLHTAIHSLKKALYYRLKLDDAAIDAAQ